MDDLQHACRVRAVSFDFESKTTESIEPSGIGPAISRGEYVWVDVEVRDVERAIAAVRKLDLDDAEPALETALRADPASHCSRSETCLHFVIEGCRLEGSELDAERVDAVVTRTFLLTSWHKPALFLETMRQTYRSDFVEHAKSPSFLIYELWDHVTENYVDVHERFEARVERLQSVLTHEVDDAIFQRVAELQGGLLQMRKVLVPGRAIVQELATRKSVYVSEGTQPYLVALGSMIERVLQDLMTDRDILAGTLDLHMTIVNHRTNEVVKRLTSVSIIFLPLTFLCGVWGMNFRYMPELHWSWGYGLFWVLVVMMVAIQVIVLRKMKML